jgi:hypothetical protein
MPGFNCKNCGEDLAYQIDIFVRSLQREYESFEDVPEDLFVKGKCHECGVGFELSGPMFTSYAIARAEEGVVSDEVSEYDLVDLSVTEEEYNEFIRLNEEGTEEELEEFLRNLVQQGRIR